MQENNLLIKKITEMNLPTLAIHDIKNLQNKLSISFSKEFYDLSNLGDFEYTNIFNIYNLNLDTDYSVIGETTRLRKECNLPHDTLYLSEDDASVLLMKCLGDHEEIYWIAIEDFERYCNGEPLLYDATIFKTFSEFFEYLLDKEEESRAEEESNP
jgi:hypothetical protein